MLRIQMNVKTFLLYLSVKVDKQEKKVANKSEWIAIIVNLMP